MEFKYSRRAKILEEVLQYIDNGDWERRDGFLIFGKEQFQIATGELIDDNPEFQPDPSLATKVKLNRGERIVAARTTLEQLPKDRTVEHILEWMLSLPKEVRDAVTAGLESHPQRFAGSTAEEVEAEAMDSYLAWEALETLDIAFARVGGFEDVPRTSGYVSNPEYFDEAHGCDLAGLNIASAVLCRAVLEDALKKIIDPTGKILSRIPSENRRLGRTLSPIGVLIDLAKKRHLDAALIQFAKDVHEAGNDAIHDLPAFKNNRQADKNNHQAETNDYLYKTRLVVDGLCALKREI